MSCPGTANDTTIPWGIGRHLGTFRPDPTPSPAISPSSALRTMPTPEPFTFAVPETVLEDLRSRLRATRYPDDSLANEEGGGLTWKYGMPTNVARKLVDHWLNKYDWRKWEAKMNTFKNFKLEVAVPVGAAPDDPRGNGTVRVHFIHERSKRADAIPLLVLHGWPTQPFEVDRNAFASTAAALTRFFRAAIGPVHGPHRTPHLAPRQLHARLPRRVPQPRRLRLLRRGPCRRVRLPGAGQGHGRDHAYDRYMVQAGDFGAMIGHMMCALLPDSCRAYHTNFDGCFIPTPGVELPPPTPFEKDRLDRSRAGFESDGRGYFAIQSTRPQSLAYGLSDSPAGLLAWIGKFFHEIVDLRGGDGDFSPSMSYDHLLTNVMVYWVTNTISSSVRQYYNFVNTDDAVIAATTKLPQPVAVAAFPMEIHAQHRAAVQHRCVQDVRWTEFEFGGHFASLERPQDLVGDVRAFAAEPRVKAALAGTEEKL
ncbi:Alpha/Beta hydrolase protein [Hyaloraphidium curvatum]|nr:Alpha/Beta hydrolase protein [Hyaloraphidium curvatum]